MEDNRAIALACRLDSEDVIQLMREISDYLLGRGEHVYFENRIASKFYPHLRREIASFTKENVKFIISVGGDGTVLRVAQNLARVNPAPILGVNLGSVGFLDESRGETNFDDLDQILSGNFMLDENMRLMVHIDGQRFPDALNEVLVASSKVSKVLYAQVTVDGVVFASSYLDGFIISTMAGSTAYALSAGGVLIDPRMSVIEIVPVNPFAGTGSIRPLIVPSTSTIEIELMRPRLKGIMSIDGQTEWQLPPKTKIVIKRSPTPVEFIRLTRVPHESFYNRLREKIIYCRNIPNNAIEE
jgi:NAD+ kinase